MRSRSVVNVPSSSSDWSLPRLSFCHFKTLALFDDSLDVVALCFLRSLRCFLRSLFSSVASIFSLAVVGVLRFLLFSMKFFVSSDLLFRLVLLFHGQFQCVVDHV